MRRFSVRTESARWADLAEADVGLDQTALARLELKTSGAWVGLLGQLDGARVLTLDSSPGRAGWRVAERASVAAFAESNPTSATLRQAMLGDAPATVVLDSEDDLVREGGWDLVILDGALRPSDPDAGLRLRRLAESLSPEGRLAWVSDNSLSPLWHLDRAAGRPTSPAGPRLSTLERLVGSAGLRVSQSFGLFRSSLTGATAFDLRAPGARAAILAAAAIRTDRVRSTALNGVRHLPSGSLLSAAVPAWLVIASNPEAPTASGGDRITGSLGYEDSPDSKIIRGEPPETLERQYSDEEFAQREATALGVLERCGIRTTPRLVARPGRKRALVSWIQGRPLPLPRLSASQTEAWVFRAGTALGAIHRATRRDDGRVLTHGDFWLGNILVSGLDVVGVVDWSGSGWGDPDDDVGHLIDATTVRGTKASPKWARHLGRAARAGHAVGFEGEASLSGRV